MLPCYHGSEGRIVEIPSSGFMALQRRSIALKLEMVPRKISMSLKEKEANCSLLDLSVELIYG